jgi:CheY-like chemotaxis protein
VNVVQPPEPIYLNADPVRLAQVFSNLLNNAAKYTDPGGTITLSVARSADHVTVSVRDSGIGLPPGSSPAIFEMFSQVSPRLDRSRSGLGIGLSLARALVELHRGEIAARSEGLGRGSEFTVRLPLAADEPGAASAPRQAEPVAGSPLRSGMRIAVIDDNVDAAESLAMLLRFMGHEVEMANEGGAALALIERSQPDLVLLDIGLPGMDGYQVARHVRTQPWGKSAVLVAVTGWGREEDRVKALASGFDHHATKPLDAERLRQILSAASR